MFRWVEVVAMPRKLILLVLAALAVGAVVSARRRRLALSGASEPVEREGNGRDPGARDSLRKFVEAGEQQRGNAPPE